MIAFLRLKKPLHDKLLADSGKFGLFMSAVASNNESKSDITPFWIQRGPKEDHESYLRRNLKLKDTRKQSVLFRFGSGITLGFPKATQGTCARKERMHFAHGIPSCENISDLARRGKAWSFLAKAPSDATDRASWQYEIFHDNEDTNTWTISVHVAVRSQNRPAPWVQIRGPKHVRTLGMFFPNNNMMLR